VQAPPPPAGGFQQTTVDAGSSAIKVTLQDCLACSGCVTSAETVLLQQQSTDELLRKLADPRTTVIATLSPQTRASLAAAHGMGVAQVRHQRWSRARMVAADLQGVRCRRMATSWGF